MKNNKKAKEMLEDIQDTEAEPKRSCIFSITAAGCWLGGAILIKLELGADHGYAKGFLLVFIFLVTWATSTFGALIANVRNERCKKTIGAIVLINAGILLFGVLAEIVG